jgi:hypothetical protein
MNIQRQLQHILQSLATQFPKTWQRVAEKRYVLPKYRQEDYYNQDLLNFYLLDHIMAFGRGAFEDDAPNTAAYINECLALEYGRPTFYLERELGAAFLRTEVPGDLEADDIHWRWPQMRIVIPKGLITIERGGQPRNLIFIDVAQVDASTPTHIPDECALELETHKGWKSKAIRFRVEGECLVTQSLVDCATTANPFASVGYGGTQPIEHMKLNAIRLFSNIGGSMLPIDDLDQRLVAQIDSLLLNILLYMSEIPVEHEPKELRKPKVEGKRFISGLYPARFVGDLQLRSKPRPREEAEPTGRHLPGHWRSGHWRRQAHGPGWAKHKLIWILPYRTTGETDEKPNISGSNEIALEIQQQ